MQKQYFIVTRGGDSAAITFKDAVLNTNAVYGVFYTLENKLNFSNE